MHDYHGHEHTHDSAALESHERDVVFLRYMLRHNQQHVEELKASIVKFEENGDDSVCGWLRKSVEYYCRGNQAIEEALQKLEG